MRVNGFSGELIGAPHSAMIRVEFQVGYQFPSPTVLY